MRKFRQFSLRHANFSDILLCRSIVCRDFSDTDVPRTDDIRLSMLLIPTSNVDLHNRPPPTKHKIIFRRLHLPSRHVFTSCPVVASLRTHLVCLFVRSFARLLIGLLLRRLSAPCRCVPSHLVAPPRRCAVLSLVVPLVSSSSCRHVSSCLVVVSCPLTHLVTPALFDCCIVTLHLVVTASFCLVVPLVSSSSHHVSSSCRSVASRLMVVASRSVAL
jgi:hypothetical protein